MPHERTYTAGGLTLTAKEWAKKQFTNPNAFRKRVYQRMKFHGMTEEEAILKPVLTRQQASRLKKNNSPWRKTNSRLFNSWLRGERREWDQ